MSQLHAVDGGTTYGLPYDSLLPLLREEGETALSCKWLMAGVTWWANICRGGGLPPLQPLSPRGLFELCLREAEVAADCWRGRNGLPAAAAAAGGAGGASGSRSRDGGRDTNSCRSSSSSSKEQASRAVKATCSTGVNPRLTSLDVIFCPMLASLALDCSRCIVLSCCSAGASKGASGGRAGSGGGAGTGDLAVSGDGVGNGEGGGGSGGAGERGGNGARAGESGGAGNREGATDAGDGPMENAGGAVPEAASESPATWLGDGGPLARRWWRAAVAAVHCGLDQHDPRHFHDLAAHAGRILCAPVPAPGQGEFWSSVGLLLWGEGQGQFVQGGLTLCVAAEHG